MTSRLPHAVAGMRVAVGPSVEVMTSSGVVVGGEVRVIGHHAVTAVARARTDRHEGGTMTGGGGGGGKHTLDKRIC